MPCENAEKNNPWRLIREELTFDCQYFAVRRDLVSHTGRAPRPYNSVRMKRHGVCVAPVDRNGCVTLVGQYRYVLDRYTWEVPGGGAPIDELALDVAKAELSEETGLRADHWLKIVEGSVSPGTADEIVPSYVAWGIHRGEPHPDPEERLSLRVVPFAEAVAMALHGQISNLPGVALLLGIQVRLQRGDLPGSLVSLLS